MQLRMSAWRLWLRPELRLANLTDVHLIEQARNTAQTIFTADPDLKAPEHQLLHQSLKRFWNLGQGDIS